MKKLNLHFDLNNILAGSQKSSWQKAVLLALTIGTIIIIGAEAYLLIKPTPKEIREIIDEDISAVDINFDQNILDSIKARQTPAETRPATTGKNPFLGL